MNILYLFKSSDFNYNLMLKVCFREYFSSIIAIFKEVN